MYACGYSATKCRMSWTQSVGRSGNTMVSSSFLASGSTTLTVTTSDSSSDSSSGSSLGSAPASSAGATSGDGDGLRLAAGVMAGAATVLDADANTGGDSGVELTSHSSLASAGAWVGGIANLKSGLSAQQWSSRPAIEASDGLNRTHTPAGERSGACVLYK